MRKLLVILAMAFTLNVNAQDVNVSEDPNMARAEQMLGYMLKDETDSLFNSFSDQVKGLIPKDQLKGAIGQLKPILGDYKSHSAWEAFEKDGRTFYVSTMEFTNGKMPLVAAFDNDGKALAFSVIPQEIFDNTFKGVKKK